MMHQKMKLDVAIVTCLAIFTDVANAFWRLPCRGRSGVARIDPIMAPGIPSDHVHAVHGSGGFSMSANEASLKQSSCTSCAVTQDKSAYWAPALYFVHQNGDAELVNEVGGMLAYYLLNGENVKTFPENFRMMAGDTYLRDFPWPIPDPPQSEWSGNDLKQEALRQKAVGFNCLNYQKDPEPSLGRHFLPNKTYLDEHCTEGVRFELMFPSCWNGKDIDTPDHKSHLAYPSLVMDGECPKGFEHRLVSLFYESIWDTYAFKSKKGNFVLANGDPTGYGYHGDFMYGWDSQVLQQAVDTCTNMSGEVTDCPVFTLQSDEKQDECRFSVPDALKNEDVNYHKGGLPNNVAIQSGPAYASPVRYTTTTTTTTGAGGHGRPTPVYLDDLPTVGVGIDLGFLSAGLHVALPTLTTSSTTTTAKAWEPTAPPDAEGPPARPITSKTSAHTTFAAPFTAATSVSSVAQLSIPSESVVSEFSSVTVKPSLSASSSALSVLSTMATKSSVLLASVPTSSSAVLAKPVVAPPAVSTGLTSTIPQPSLAVSSMLTASSIDATSSLIPSAPATSSNLFAVSSPALASPSAAVQSSVLIPPASNQVPIVATISSTSLVSPTSASFIATPRSSVMGVPFSFAASGVASSSVPLFNTANTTVPTTQAIISAALIASPASPSTDSMATPSTSAKSSATSTPLIKTALPVPSTLAVAAKPPALTTPSSTSAPLIKTATQMSNASEIAPKPNVIASANSSLAKAPPTESSTFAVVAKPAVTTTSPATSVPLIKSTLSSTTPTAKPSVATHTTSTALIKTTVSASSTLAMSPRPAVSPQTEPSSWSSLEDSFASADWEVITTWSPPSSTSSAEPASSTTIVYVEQAITVLVDDQGVPIETQTGSLETVSRTTTTSSGSATSSRPPSKRGWYHNHAHRHYRHGHSH